MATTISQMVLNLATRVATQFNTVKTSLGVNTNLTTDHKSTLVGAINEVNAKPSGGSGGPAINDTTPSTTSTYSSSKTDSQIASARAGLKSELLDGVGSELDTLKEVAAKFASSDSDVSSLAGVVATKVSFTAQTLTDAQKAQARTNTGSAALADLGDLNADPVAVFNAALA